MVFGSVFDLVFNGFQLFSVVFDLVFGPVFVGFRSGFLSVFR